MSLASGVGVVIGLAGLCADPPAQLRGARLGLLCNPACVLPDLTPAPEAVARALPGGLCCLFGPQHGFFADKQDNMVESDHCVHPRLGVPVFSLYGQTRRPRPEWLTGLDVLLVDLVDVGCRVYTFFNTLVACLEEAAASGVAVWALDRPNPIGRGEEGPILPRELFSFVGVHEMPLRHGLSLGELARLVRAERGLDLDLNVLPVQGWDGGGFSATGLPWVMPSPNLPTLEAVRVYPGQVLLEGTTLSEGRGTTRPFEIFGAPGLDPWLVAQAVEPAALAGATLRPLFFEPTFHKFAGQTCGGWQVHVTEPRAFRPVLATCAILSALGRAQPGLWGLRPPPYEYEHERLPLDLLLGDVDARQGLLAGGLGLGSGPGLGAGSRALAGADATPPSLPGPRPLIGARMLSWPIPIGEPLFPLRTPIKRVAPIRMTMEMVMGDLIKMGGDRQQPDGQDFRRRSHAQHRFQLHQQRVLQQHRFRGGIHVHGGHIPPPSSRPTWAAATGARCFFRPVRAMSSSSTSSPTPTAPWLSASASTSLIYSNLRRDAKEEDVALF